MKFENPCCHCQAHETHGARLASVLHAVILVILVILNLIIFNEWKSRKLTTRLLEENFLKF